MASGRPRCCTRRAHSRPRCSRSTEDGEPWITEQMHEAAPICTHFTCSPSAPKSGFRSVAKTEEPSTSSTSDRAMRKTVSAQASRRWRSASWRRLSTTCRIRGSSGTTVSPCSSASSPRSFTLSQRPSGFRFVPASPMQLMTIGNQSGYSVRRNSRISSTPVRWVSWSLRRLSANSSFVLSSARAWLLSRMPKVRPVPNIAPEDPCAPRPDCSRSLLHPPPGVSGRSASPAPGPLTAWGGANLGAAASGPAHGGPGSGPFLLLSS
mmetsp:Transcript_59935/g.130047  ORF Transcript_59935/g.130047 Transcript_59935/m.130047 type:complete len:265 (-) Transcript_59935:3-797(-)